MGSQCQSSTPTSQNQFTSRSAMSVQLQTVGQAQVLAFGQVVLTSSSRDIHKLRGDALMSCSTQHSAASPLKLFSLSLPLSSTESEAVCTKYTIQYLHAGCNIGEYCRFDGGPLPCKQDSGENDQYSEHCMYCGVPH
eukprot:TRINITY_DN59059_c0_g2_i1.p1 TRINITY_DN59059_c0_g2~~TRINITY_DN59059_c0_g2_i1.p1  ORF type:complete len:137 (+),score=9.84 TRINITY_DN59059_c0_g2_i1:424-834(+)